MSTKPNSQREHGFTIVEVAIIVPIISLMVASIVVVLVTLITSIAVQNGRNTLTYDTKNVLDQLEKDVSYGSTFVDTLPSNFNSSSFPSDSTKIPNNYKVAGTPGTYVYQPAIRTLLIKSYDQSKNPNGSSSVIPTALGNPPCANQFDITTGGALPIMITYFVDKGTLYRRITPDNTSGTATCSTPIYKKNCPATAADCRPRDTAILSGVTKFDINYYASAGDAYALGDGDRDYDGNGTKDFNGDGEEVYYSDYPQTPGYPLISTAKSIRVDIETKKLVSGSDITYNVSTRLNRDN